MSRSVIILGMHRSGTSCLTGSLHEAGLHLGDVNQRSRCNEKGTRENLGFMELNDALLATVDAAWNNPPKKNVVWRTEHLAWRRRLIEATAQPPVWGFKDPRTIFTLDGWLEALPDAQLIATFRNPYAVAQSLNKRNDIPLEHGLELWRAYNERLLEICRRRKIAVINFDWSVERYKRGLEVLCSEICLDAPANGFKFFESKLRRNKPRSHGELPAPLRAMHRRLQYEARRTMRDKRFGKTASYHLSSHPNRDATGSKWISAAGATPLAKIHAHSMRLFPKGEGANKYKVTGVASRCDWVVLTDRNEPTVELRRQRNTATPRHIFLSMRAPFLAINYFASEVLPQLTSPFVLVSGSEDVTLPGQTDKRWRTFNDDESGAIKRILDHKMLRRWFTENLVDNSDSRFAPLPTGLVFEDGDASHQIAVGTPPSLFDRPLRILCGHRVRDGAQWLLRKKVTAIAENEWAQWCTVTDGELPIDKYLRLMMSHAFVLCVEGGGVDPSPKAWQAILYGAIPIIRRGAHSSAYQELPVAFVDDWTPDAITRKRLEGWRRDLAPAHAGPENRLDTLRRLGLDYWWDKVERAARD